MDERVKKYLEDILKAIWEIQVTTDEKGRQYNVFLKDFVFRKFVERNIEIIGEAMNRILKFNWISILLQHEKSLIQEIM